MGAVNFLLLTLGLKPSSWGNVLRAGLLALVLAVASPTLYFPSAY